MAPANPIYVIGHRNPDADSICSAIAYAAFKQARGEHGYLAARCGNSNARIDAILERFHTPLPHYLSDVYPRVRDMMSYEPLVVHEEATCAEALSLIDRHGITYVPVVSDQNKAVGSLTLAQLGHFFIPRLDEPRAMRQVRTSLARIARTLQGAVLHTAEENRIEDLYVRIGAMDVRTFWSISEREQISAAQSLIIVGDRRDIQHRSIELGVRALVITGSLPVDPEIVSLAKERGVGLISSPHDTATTAWFVRTASTVGKLADRRFNSLNAEARIADVRRKFSQFSPHAMMVTGEDNLLQGILTKSDLLKPVPTRLVLVDHNELTQAVPGADEVVITEILDHHRLGPVATSQPILFINEPVGSTCTIVADHFRRHGIAPSADLAGIMMSGLISDTLLLQSPTSTPKDADVLNWLQSHADIKAQELAHLIFSSGSVILANPADKVVRSDFKVYAEEGVRFAVSQVEELGFDNFWQHATQLSQALADLRATERLAFAALLVTDINTQNSLMLAKGDPEFIRRISYAHVQQDEIFDLPGVVSRKKQLIPYLTDVLKAMSHDDVSPGTRNRSGAPFTR
ncbi:putative manganese-dependent inorganic diphosphatase [Oleiharenicola lentus]|jgi:manganese-dependent inorganic pyrophosphatase|uniref:inorganic diphosphatase n=1 Tax=Oleiharenicola lentus TaxID=2508720 RepID=A0A4Q1CBR4_9BACT|nr:putative manganese-dependent inorganic diphosphatase [Oleiharenicola lentus]RXK56553.1 putative manganese-dependent inorganic diphosphatase [Oleiharenicola lentus]